MCVAFECNVAMYARECMWATTGQDGWTALIYAAVNGHADCARLLLNAGADRRVQTMVRACRFFACGPSAMGANWRGVSGVLRLVGCGGEDFFDNSSISVFLVITLCLPW